MILLCLLSSMMLCVFAADKYMVPVCGKNSTFVQCKGCPLKCSNMYLKEPCITKCESGCVCNPGLVRNRYGDCVDPSICLDEEICCPKYEELGCTSDCLKTCANMYLVSKPCCDRCKRGCVCKTGYVRNSSGCCVLPHKCPPAEIKCPPGKVYSTCDAGCRMTCSNFKETRSCKLCIPGCICQNGKVEDYEGNCVYPKDCQVKITCPKGLEYQKCGCHFSCDSPYSYCENCKAGCYCPNGLVYNNETSTCIYKSECPYSYENQGCHKLDENSEYRYCGSYCPPTCANLTPQPSIQQCVSGCFCKAGYVLNKNGKCINPDKC